MYDTDLPSRADLPTTAQLIRSTLIAAGAATTLLITVVLPAEYAIDPTGLGKALGLQEMGEIKHQLEKEVEADAVAVSSSTQIANEPSEKLVLRGKSVTEAIVSGQSTTQTPSAEQQISKDNVVLTLAAGEAAEVKLVMTHGQKVSYEWSVDQGHLNSDLHGGGNSGQSTSYRKGRAEARNRGELTAAFNGSHGWFWCNRSNVPRAIALKV